MKYNITYKNIVDFRKSFKKKRSNKVFKNINTKVEFNKLIIDSDVIQRDSKEFTNKIDIKSDITNQENSGRCWIFAILNIIRLDMIREYNLSNFEFSENFIYFYDRLEKANFFLNYIADHYNTNIHDIKLIHILESKTSDGNQWIMFRNLITKYGIIPKNAMADMFHSKNTNELNHFFNNYLIKSSVKIITALKKNNSQKNKEQLITSTLSEFYNILVIFLGEPPKQFNWQYSTKKIKKKLKKEKKGGKKKSSDEADDNDDADDEPEGVMYKTNEYVVSHPDLTPLTFFHKFVKYNVDNKICLINYPCKNIKYYKKYHIELTPNVIGGKQQELINVPQVVMFNAIKRAIDDNQAVFCGVDWDKFNTKEYSLLDTKAFNYDDIFGDNIIMDKCNGLQYRQSTQTHAVIIRGYNIIKGEIDKFLIENSHGNNNNFNGKYSMSVDWFNKYLYQIVIDKKYLDKKVVDVEKTKSIMLPFNSPFGSLMF
jgi:bleomycin hydrolase